MLNIYIYQTDLQYIVILYTNLQSYKQYFQPRMINRLLISTKEKEKYNVLFKFSN